MEFIRSFQSEAPLKRGVVSAQDASLQERVLAQVKCTGPKGFGKWKCFISLPSLAHGKYVSLKL